MKSFINLCLRNGPFVLSFFALLITFVLAIFKNLQVDNLLPTILGLYLGSKVSTGVSAHWAASKDEKADTNQTIRDVEGIEKDKKDEN